MEIDYYNDHYKHIYQNFNLKGFEKVILREHKEILLDKNKTILDVGCGAGFLLKVLENLGFSELSGVEISTTQIQEAKKILTKSKIYNMDIFDFFEKNSNKKYDVIFLYDVIEHIEKDKIIYLLKIIFNLLNNEGVLIIRTTNADSPFFSGMMRYIDFTHSTSFNKESIKMVLRSAGFNKIENRKTKSIFLSGFGRLVTFPIQFFGDLLTRLYLFTYLGFDSFKIILTPNFITVAKK